MAQYRVRQARRFAEQIHAAYNSWNMDRQNHVGTPIVTVEGCMLICDFEGEKYVITVGPIRPVAVITQRQEDSGAPELHGTQEPRTDPDGT